MKEIALSIQNISKDFNSVHALKQVSFDIYKGEVHGLIGENGAGKSTLINILSGVFHQTKGSILVNGENFKCKSPLEAEKYGIATVHQEISLLPELSVAENIFLGRLQKNRVGIIQWEKIYKEAELLIHKLGIKVDVKEKVANISVAKMQMIEIGRTMIRNPNIVILDEATSTLTNSDIEILFSIITKLKKANKTILFVSHRLNELFDITDRITVLRDGEYIETKNTSQWERKNLIEKLVGRSIQNEFPQRTASTGEIVFAVNNLNQKSYLKNISFVLHKGEILGLAGLIGAGRTELVRALFGVDGFINGTISVHGKKLKKITPSKCIKERIALLTENRKKEGLSLQSSVKDNISICNLQKIKRLLFLNSKKEKNIAYKYVQELFIKTPSILQKVCNLSGGNQQKVVLAKWLFSEADILFLDEPTRGIDVGAKKEIYDLMNQLTKMGKSIIFISSEMPELIAMSDRIMIMRDGTFVKTISKDEATQEKIMNYAIK